MQFDGHQGPITAVSSHRAAGGQVDLSHLFLTSSFDWTVKLWSTRLQNEQQLTVSSFNSPPHPLPLTLALLPPCTE